MSVEKAKKVSIFIGFTPYHAYVAGHLIEDSEGKVYCYFSKSWPKSDRGYKRLGFSQRWLMGLNQVLSFFYFSLVTRLLAARGFSLDVYMPHPGNIFTNYLFFARRSRRRIFIYEDGILNYYDALQRNTFVGIGKQCLSWMGLMPYRRYVGHLAGYDEGNYDGAFLSMPELAVRKSSLGRVHLLPMAKKTVKLDRQVVLFLDQNVENFLEAEKRQACLSEMFKQYPPWEYQYIYKPHHDFNSDVQYQMTKLSLGELELPAEILVEKILPGYVISFYSSALINIKRVFPDITCISLASKMVSIGVDGQQESLSNLFMRAGVECLCVDHL